MFLALTRCFHVQELINKWETSARDHEQYDVVYADTHAWLCDVSKRLQQCSDVTGERQVLEERQAQVQELQVEKEAGGARLQGAVEQGEKLYATTSSEGREIIRQQLRYKTNQKQLRHVNKNYVMYVHVLSSSTKHTLKAKLTHLKC